MITEWETNTIYLVSPLKCYENIETIYVDLLKHKHPEDKIKIISDPRLDIWVRDFAPIQVSLDKFKQFIYKPTYISSKMAEDISASFRKHHSFSVEKVDLRLDGGNFIHNGKIGITTEKIVRTNRELSRKAIIDKLCESFDLNDVIIIPSIPKEVTGHIDGMVRFVNKTTILVDVDCWGLAEKITSMNGYEVIPIGYKKPHVFHGKFLDATGLYVNFIQTKNQFYVPSFNQKEDEVAYKIFEKFGKEVKMINSSNLAKYGGLLNCMSWTTLENYD